MLGFETLTFAPIDRRLIDVQMLDPEELIWLNCYHAHVLAKIGPTLCVAASLRPDRALNCHPGRVHLLRPKKVAPAFAE